MISYLELLQSIEDKPEEYRAMFKHNNKPICKKSFEEYLDDKERERQVSFHSEDREVLIEALDMACSQAVEVENYQKEPIKVDFPEPTISSLELARYYDKSHEAILLDILALFQEEEIKPNAGLVEYKSLNDRACRMYNLPMKHARTLIDEYNQD